MTTRKGKNRSKKPNPVYKSGVDEIDGFETDGDEFGENGDFEDFGE